MWGGRAASTRRGREGASGRCALFPGNAAGSELSGAVGWKDCSRRAPWWREPARRSPPAGRGCSPHWTDGQTEAHAAAQTSSAGPQAPGTLFRKQTQVMLQSLTTCRWGASLGVGQRDGFISQQGPFPPPPSLCTCTCAGDSLLPPPWLPVCQLGRPGPPRGAAAGTGWDGAGSATREGWSSSSFQLLPAQARRGRCHLPKQGSWSLFPDGKIEAQNRP